MTRLLGIGGSFPLLTRRLKPRRTGTLSRSSRYIRTDLWTPELSAMADCPSKFTSEGDVRLGHQEAAQTLRGSGLPGTGANARLWALRQEEHFLTVSMVLPGPSALLPPPPISLFSLQPLIGGAGHLSPPERILFCSFLHHYPGSHHCGY